MHEVLLRHGGGVVDHGGGSLVHGAGVITSSVTMAGVDMTKCKPAAFQEAIILCKVGLLDKFEPLQTIRPPNAPSSEIYVNMSLKPGWLVKAVTGYYNPGHGSVYRTRLLKDLRLIVQRACEGDIPLEDESAVAEEDDDNEEHDPMDEIELETPTKLNRCKRRRVDNSSKQRRQFIANKHKVVVTEFPQVPPEVDPNTEARRKIKLYIEGRSRNQIYLHKQDVEWAVKYMYAQHVLKGVGVVPGDSAGPGN